MATQTIYTQSSSGITSPVAKLFVDGSDTVQATADSVTERTNDKGTHVVVVTSTLTGLHKLVMLDGSGNYVSYQWVKLANVTADYYAHDSRVDALGEIIASSLGTQAKTDVNTELLDVLAVDTHAELAQGAPAATNTIRGMIQWMFKLSRNKTEMTTSEKRVYNDAGNVVDHKAPLTKASGINTHGEYVSGP